MVNIKHKQTIETTCKMLNLMTLGCRIEAKSPQRSEDLQRKARTEVA